MRVPRLSICAPRISRAKIFHASAPAHSPVVFPCILDIFVNGMVVKTVFTVIVKITETSCMKTIFTVIVKITKASCVKTIFTVIVEIIDDWMRNGRGGVICAREVIATFDF